MGFGAIIGIGENNAPLDEDLAGCIVEARVEQKLDEPIQFALRFLDDLEDGRLRHANDDRLAIDTIVSVMVEVGNALACLVRGPIVEHKSEMVIGGPGSWFEIHGLDRRDLLDRICVQATWTGRASDAAHQILGQAFDELDVEDTTRVYEEARETLNPRATDLDLVRRVGGPPLAGRLHPYAVQQVAPVQAVDLEPGEPGPPMTVSLLCSTIGPRTRRAMRRPPRPSRSQWYRSPGGHPRDGAGAHPRGRPGSAGRTGSARPAFARREPRRCGPARSSSSGGVFPPCR